MEVTRDLEFERYILDKIRKREFQERTGIHCSDLIYCLNKQAIRRILNTPSEDDEVLLFSLGWSTQRWLSGRIEDEPEVEVDGIKVTLDALYLDCPWELKASYQGSERDVTENLPWVKQLMAQCYACGTPDYASEHYTARLSRFEIMGNWKWVFGKKEEKLLAKRPTLSAWRFQFTRQEVVNNWLWLLDRAELFKGILATKVLLPKAIAMYSGTEWQCQYCKSPELCEKGVIE